MREEPCSDDRVACPETNAKEFYTNGSQIPE